MRQELSLKGCARLTVAFLVQHHPARSPLLDRLLPQLPEEAVVVSDPNPDGGPNPWRTYRQCLEAAHDTGASHAVVVQDDVTPCRNFGAACEKAIAARPDRVLALWHGGQPAEHRLMIDAALGAGQCWVEMWSRRWTPTVALAWPVRLVCPVVCWVEEAEYPDGFRADDEIVGNALRALGETVLAAVPSLVEHEDLVESVIGRRAKGGLDPARVAHRWIGPDADPLALDWTRGAS